MERQRKREKQRTGKINRDTHTWIGKNGERDGWRDGQVDRQADRQADWQTDGQTDRKAHGRSAGGFCPVSFGDFGRLYAGTTMAGTESAPSKA